MTMTLKKCHVMVYIVYFIILLKLVVINVVTAQEETDSPIPSSDENGCGETGACIKVNDTLKFCDGLLKDPPDNGTYKPQGVLGKCMCNQEYYDSLNTCLECFVDETSLEYHVAPLEEYKKECKTLEIPFAQNAPTTPQTKIPATIKLGLAAGIVVVLLCLFGIIALQYFRRKKKKDAGSKPPKSKVTDEKYEKYSSPDTSSAHYPSTFYPPPPSDIHSPSPQSTTPYYPPPSSEYSGEYPPPQQPPPHGSQGGQADSYFRGDF